MGASFRSAAVEAKADYKHAGDGSQQAMDYAEILGLQFAYSTNGHGIVEHGYITGQEQKIDYAGATALFADPAFDGVPANPPRVKTIDTEGQVIDVEEMDAYT